MLVVGLTGGIASGKSTVSGYLKDLGAAVIDADQLAREMVQASSPVLREIAACFGEGVLDESGQLDRKKLAHHIFAFPAAREKLNSILHPRIIEKVRELIADYREEGKAPLIVVDAPLLLEAGMQDMVDEVWVVSVPFRDQLERVMQRDGISREEAEARLNAQMPLAEKLRYADRIIDNSRDLKATLAGLDRLWAEVTNIT